MFALYLLLSLDVRLDDAEALGERVPPPLGVHGVGRVLGVEGGQDLVAHRVELHVHLVEAQLNLKLLIEPLVHAVWFIRDIRYFLDLDVQKKLIQTFLPNQEEIIASSIHL